MNLQIVSNTEVQGKTNKTNDFKMNLMHAIDGLNNEAYIEVLEICYPATTKNINDDTCSFQLTLKYKNFVKDVEVQSASKTLYHNYDHAVAIIINPTTIPRGIYNMENLLKFMNNVLNKYDIYMNIADNGKIRIFTNVYIEYWLNQKKKLSGKNYTTEYAKLFAHDGEQLGKFHLALASAKNEVKKCDIEIDLQFSEKLAFMLGFSNEQIHFEQLVDGNAIYDTTTTVYSDFLPDVSDGLNKIFIYCDELEPILVGDSSSELLATVPINWSRQGEYNGELIRFTPVRVKRKFKKTKTNSLSISLRDTAGKLIPFDSGTVSLECLIHYAKS